MEPQIKRFKPNTEMESITFKINEYYSSEINYDNCGGIIPCDEHKITLKPGITDINITPGLYRFDFNISEPDNGLASEIYIMDNNNKLIESIYHFNGTQSALLFLTCDSIHFIFHRDDSEYGIDLDISITITKE